jgi:hypothetical protein
MKRLFTIFLACGYLFMLAGIAIPTPNETVPPSAHELTPSISGEWQANTQAFILENEYHLTQFDGEGETISYQAPNRAHNLRVSFGPDRVWVTPRLSPKDWAWGLQLVAYGGAGQEQAVPVPTQHVDENQITYQRPGLSEWYINNANGLEQGFTLMQPPGGASSQEIALEMSILGTLTPQLDTGRGTLELQSSDGVTVLQFGKLFAFDANHSPLAAHMELTDRRLRLVVQTAGAAYPITVDPLVTGNGWSADSDQVYAQMGYSVSSAGDVNRDGFSDVIIGAPYFDNGQVDEGRAYVFLGSATGIITTTSWIAEGNLANALFGSSVSAAGDVNGDGYGDVIIGAPGYANGQAQEGRAYVYHGDNSASGLSATPNWSYESDFVSARFGQSVASAGDVNRDGYSDVIIGAPGCSNGQTNEGCVFVFHGSTIGLNVGPNWMAESDQSGSNFGISVSSAGDTNRDGFADIVIGADQFTHLWVNEGGAFLWLGSAAGVNDDVDGVLTLDGSTPDAKWSAFGGQANASFGHSVTAVGDADADGYADVAVGAPFYDNPQMDEGKVYVYQGVVSGLNTASVWDAESDQAGAHFGTAVASAGDANGDGYADLLVGAEAYTQSVNQEGAAFVWFGSPTGITSLPDVDGLPANAAWSAYGGQADAHFGFSVSSAGDVNGDGFADLLVGAPDNDNGENGEGCFRGYSGGGYMPSSTLEDWSMQSNFANAFLGDSISSAGDVNGDGYDDVIVGAFYYGAGGSQTGRVYLYYGGANGLDTSAPVTVDGTQAGENFGSAVSKAGDVNGDGYGDILVGSWHYDSGSQPDVGRVYLYYGSGTGLNTSPSWMVEGTVANAALGVSLGSAGDVNGDGYSDVLLGARSYSDGQINEGAAFLYYGSWRGLNSTPDWQTESNQANAYLGCGVNSAGDVNRDGYDDILVGAYGYINSLTNEGAAFLWYGSSHGPNLGISEPAVGADWIVYGNQANATFGYSVGSAGDTNGDHYDDIIIGGRNYDRGNNDEGAVMVWYGSAAGISGTNPTIASDAPWSAESNVDSAQLGYVLAGSAGDVNGDGYSDVIAGAFRYSDGEYQEGAAFVWSGSQQGVNRGIPGNPSNAAWSGQSNQDGAGYGYSTATAGDVNGDGYSDIIVSAMLYEDSPAEENEGRIYLYYGNQSDGRQVLPRQRSADNALEIMPGGQAISPNSVRLSAFAQSPTGRSNVRLQWEIKPFNQALDGTNMGTSIWVDSGDAGLTISQLVSNLTMETRYHWRLRIQSQPLDAISADLVTYRGRWNYGETFFTSLTGSQPITQTGRTQLLGQSAYISVTTQGTLTRLYLHDYPNTAHPLENVNGNGATILDRYFTITTTNVTAGYNLTLCLNYNDDEVPSGEENRLRLCRWTGSTWACTIRSPLSNTTTNLVCGANVTAFSDWIIGGTGGVTAIELNRFQGTPLKPVSLWFFLVTGLSATACILFLHRARHIRLAHKK